MTAREIYDGSDGAATTALYAELEKRGPQGVIAMNLFRACKASARAKVYRGGNSHGRFKDQAYQKKEWSLGKLCEALAALPGKHECCSAPGCGYPDGKPCIGCGKVVDHGVFLWGWKEDPAQEYHRWVLYLELPSGQVSFHAARPIVAPRVTATGIDSSLQVYPGEWDRQHLSAERIVTYTQAVMDGTMPLLFAQHSAAIAERLGRGPVTPSATEPTKRAIIRGPGECAADEVRDDRPLVQAGLFL